MRSTSFLRVAAFALAVGFAGAVGATSALAQSQYQSYSYGLDVAPQIQTQQAQLPATMAQGPSAYRSDAGQVLIPANSATSSFNPEAWLTENGANVQ